ncbi:MULTISPECIES: phytanoyl-CoA dioxygenase family protein [unclassified Sulfurospirillum]|uniref:phytanoyl-CoA dioxygenase family protein n=1 Tax=unclassified Sulfurospirillum TaxID=2618290 RepID=UPI000506E4F0|nr:MULTISPECIES: phytanoyl-CoA dioxygenase family protein [unclassified Sulfurospirillum]KFL34231.1 hypothetical protein JU57_06770 [Sulfurospirillum sp. SCADC]
MFNDLLKRPDKNLEEIETLLKKEILKVQESHNVKESLFGSNGADIKFLLQSYPSLFWSLWKFMDKKHLEKAPCSIDPITKALDKDGIYIIENFLTSQEVQTLVKLWNHEFDALPPLTPEQEQKALRNRFYFETSAEKNIAIGSTYDGRKRVIFSPKKHMPSEIQNQFYKDTRINEIVARYLRLDHVEPSAAIVEHFFAPDYYRNNDLWHIDNLSDQFKVMVILEDMKENDGPFKFIRRTHKIKKRYQDRYYKMYAINGMTTQEHNHFEDSFAKVKKAELGVLKAGDIVLFDTKIHHSFNYAYDGGSRKDMVLYFDHQPTLKNTILFHIDQYLNFGLR